MTVEIREVEKKDWDFILQVRNEKEIREVSHNSEIITKSEHYRYMENLDRMGQSGVHQWMVLYKNKNAGYVKIVNEEISFMLEVNSRGKGIGKKFNKLVNQECRRMGIKKLVARVLIHNHPSLKLLHQIGYVETNVTKDENNNPYEVVLELSL